MSYEKLIIFDNGLTSVSMQTRHRNLILQILFIHDVSRYQVIWTPVLLDAREGKVGDRS